MAAAVALRIVASHLVVAAVVASGAIRDDAELLDIAEANFLLQVAFDVDPHADVRPLPAIKPEFQGVVHSRNKSSVGVQDSRGLKFEVAASGATARPDGTRSGGARTSAPPALPYQALIDLNVTEFSDKPLKYRSPAYWTYWETSRCSRILGTSKLAWALICDSLAMFLILLCIPLLLTCSRRRAAGSPLFDCSCGDKEYDVDDVGNKVSLNVFEM
mmetsp:Transcript_20914/g.47626  ORF Transcript_20914/g.47626 Transcript_20914/m.47626 type:complete len:216 (-) Transcript_20914:78-725(-)